MINLNNSERNGIAGTFGRIGRTLRLSCCALLFVPGTAVAVSGAEIDAQRQLLTELSLEQLMEIPVFSASRKNQTLSDVSSAVFVISQEDIRHSGATTIPDLLRMVPGVQVASADGSSWAVSIRGFNGTFANKLLVMIDGRSVYTPLYGGVFWDVQDTMLENIERIEVIRGSGGTMWGANAVNGVINIITKSSHDTQNGLLTGLIGSRENGTLSVSYGNAINEETSYRLYVKHMDRGRTPATAGPPDDSLDITRGGFRIDSELKDNLNLTLQGDLYYGTATKTATTPILSAPYSSTQSMPAYLSGGNILTRFDWKQSEASMFSFQFYYDRTGRMIKLIKDERDTFDIDLQHNLRLAGIHELTWGAGYRFLHDDAAGTRNVFLLTPASRSDHLLNMFLQDEISLMPEKLRFIVGTKFEHNDYTGWELQPSARLLWTPNKQYSIWTAVTRSVRTPSRSEQDSQRGFMAIPPSPPVPLPSLVIATGNRQLKAETLLAYELGFRANLNETFSLDISSFYNRYSNIIVASSGTPFVDGMQITVPLSLTNLSSDYVSRGGEISLQWQPLEWWKLKGGYAYIRFSGDGIKDSQAIKATPSHQATLRSMMALGRDVDFDIWTRYVGDNRYPLVTGSVEIPAYVTVDVRLAWRPLAGLELSLVGQNLLDRRHLETVSDFTVARHEVERTIYGKVTWNF